MHLTQIAVDKIVTVDDLPCHAVGHATFSNGHRYHFTAMFAQMYGDSRVFVRGHPAGKEIHPGSPAARAIHDRLDFTEIAARERAAIGAFEYERATACQDLIPTPQHEWTPTTLSRKLLQAAPGQSAASEDSDR